MFKGVAVTLGAALAKKLGVPVEIVPHNASGEIQNSAADNKWDVAFLPVDAERKKFVDFGSAYHLLQSTFLVAPNSKMQSVKDADAAGVGIGGVANTATFRAAVKSTPKGDAYRIFQSRPRRSRHERRQDRGNRAIA
jgi:polar amino acid transport system substrate-binding protein